MLASLVDNVDITNVILVLGAIGIVVSRVGEGRGWFRSAAGLRVENTDLVRRNQELEATIIRLERDLVTCTTRTLVLEGAVRDLEKNDQSAVLTALKDHEIGAVTRANKTHSLQQESTQLLARIAGALETANGDTPKGE